MSFEDEKIVALRNAEMKKQYNTIETGIYVGDELIHFAQCRLFDGRMSIMLPDSFTDMDLEDARKKYPSENRPQVIKTNKDGTVNFTFSLLNQKISIAQLDEINSQFKLAIQKIQPANIFIDQGNKVSNNLNKSWFDFKSYSLDGTIYNFYWITVINDRMLLGIFNTPFSVWQVWELIFKRVIETVENYLQED